jgi:hypothetical protein
MWGTLLAKSATTIGLITREYISRKKLLAYPAFIESGYLAFFNRDVTDAECRLQIALARCKMMLDKMRENLYSSLYLIYSESLARQFQ